MYLELLAVLLGAWITDIFYHTQQGQGLVNLPSSSWGFWEGWVR